MPLARPVVVFSRCLGFAPCRYNGQTIVEAEVEALKPHLDVLTVCPEVGIGLGIPRDPVRLVRQDGGARLVQPATGRDVTEEMAALSRSFLDGLSSVDGFLLKASSPSCGTRDVKVYPSAGKVPALGQRTSGAFGRAVLERYPLLPVEDEGRLRNFDLRHHFLTRLFALASLREVERRGRMKDLVAFHAANKLLLMAYHQEELRRLGRIVANADKLRSAEVFARYGEGFAGALARAPRQTSHTNVLLHGLGHFSERLGREEKGFFLETLEAYRAKRVPLSACLLVLRSFVVRFGETYLASQTYFAPYPEALVSVSDSGKGRAIR